MVEKFADNLYSYQKVDILNGERPDNLSQRLYGTPDYYWTFFIANDDLKSGLSSWPKSDSELSQHTTNQFKNLSAFRFPLIEDTPHAGDRTSPLGIPITNDGYLPYLRLCFIIDSFYVDDTHVKIFANAKIRDFKPNLSQIWIDNTTFTWSSDVDAYNDQVGDGGTNDKKYSAEAKTAMFNANKSYDQTRFSVQFFEDSSTEVGLKSKFIREVLETAVQLQPSKFETDYRNMTLAEFGVNYTFINSQFWKEGKTAPAYYYDSTDINSVISEYMAGPDSDFYVSYEDEIIEQNDYRQIIKVVAPPYVDSFARDYKRLLNE